MKQKRCVYLVLVIIAVIGLAAILLPRPEKEPEKVSQTAFLMDTMVNVVVYTADIDLAKEDIAEVLQLMGDLEKDLSRHISGSQVDRINQAAGQEPVVVDTQTLGLIETALEYCRLSGGRFDITVAPLIDLWGFTSGDYQVPEEKQLQEVLPLVDYTQIQIDREKGSVFLPHEGMALDLGAIAKGYIIDCASALLEEKGYTSAYVEAGGDMRLIGEKPGEQPWRIGVKHPRESGRLGVLQLKDSSVVTSGDYERFFIQADTRYHHILNAATGMPSRGVISVTVIAEDTTSADALSTTVFIMGKAEGMALIEDLPGVEALMVDEEGRVFTSSGLAGVYQPS